MKYRTHVIGLDEDGEIIQLRLTGKWTVAAAVRLGRRAWMNGDIQVATMKYGDSGIPIVETYDKYIVHSNDSVDRLMQLRDSRHADQHACGQVNCPLT